MRCFLTVCHAQILLCVVFLGLPFSGRGEDAVVEAVWAEAEAKQLWNHREWWTLLHYHRTLWGQVASRIDDPRFFLHEKGKTSPRKELRATLVAFLEPKPLPAAEERTLACRFPARREWLLQQLGLPEELFPGGDCVDYQRSLDHLQISSATMIYPAGYLNSPASMFGHLLLVLDREGKDRLLSKAVNYAAVVGDSFGPLFAVKGIFGLYDGVFAVLPYYDKVEEYSAVNRRDIWEYPLQLDSAELDRLLRHVWELQELKSRYFFFKENCAFNLLYPIEVARPSISITPGFRMSAVPVTLLRELAATGVTGEPIFRPSAATQMDHLLSLLTEAEVERVRELSIGSAPLESDTALMLDLASSWVTFRYTDRVLSPEEYRTRIFPILRERSKRGKVDQPSISPPDPPHLSHGPRRWMPYVGVDTVNGREVAGARFRFAYHDGLDDPAGYPPGSSITMFEVDVQMDLDDSSVVLDSFTLVDIQSLTPPRPWARPMSWAASLQVEAAPFDRDHHRVEGKFSSGMAREFLGSTFYVMLTNVLRGDSDLEDHAAWEPGVEWGVLSTGSRLRAGVRGRETWGVLGTREHRRWLEAEMRWGLGRDRFVGAAVSHQRELHQNRNLVTCSFGFTF